MVEFCTNIASIIQGESLNNVAKGMDITSYRVPLGVCSGIAPFNFPVMIPLWMFPVAITCGNTYVLKVPSITEALGKSRGILGQADATFGTNFTAQGSRQHGPRRKAHGRPDSVAS